MASGPPTPGLGAVVQSGTLELFRGLEASAKVPTQDAGLRPGSPLAVLSPRNRFWPVKGRGAQQQRSLDSKAWLCPGCHAPWPRPPRPPSQGRFQRHCQTALLAWSAGTCTLQLPESLSAWPALLCPHLPSTGDQSIQFHPHPHPDSHWASAPVPPISLAHSPLGRGRQEGGSGPKAAQAAGRCHHPDPALEAHLGWGWAVWEV